MVIFGDVCGALRQKGVPGELFFTHFLNQSLKRWGWFRFLRCWMIPSPAKGKARRKPCTEKLSARFDEERDCLLYTSDAADDLLCVDLGGRRIIKKKKQKISLIHR